MRPPPFLPEETLARVIRLAKVDGTGVVLIAGGFALLSAAAGDAPGAVVGLLVAGAGALELHSVALLRQGRVRGMAGLVGSQLFLLGSILGYCAVRLAHLEPPPIPEKFGVLIDASAQQMGMSRDDYLRWVQKLALQAVAVVSIFYQGAMALYYHRRRGAVARALAGAERNGS